MNNSNTNFYRLQPLLFYGEDFREYFFFKLGEQDKRFLEIWQAIYNQVIEFLPICDMVKAGRKAYPLIRILGVRAAMMFYKPKNIKATLDFINSNPNLQTILGFENGVPSESVASRGSRKIKKLLDFKRVFDSICHEFYEGRTSQNVSMDSTPVEARETPIKTDRQTKRENSKPKKRGRKEKGGKEEKELEKERKYEEKRKKM